jgi:RHH-type transcriptional regulator, rel operon repressor / antitoxin RelB
MLAIRLPPEIEAELAAAAKRTGQTKTALARQAIINHFENTENDARAKVVWDELILKESEIVS